MGPAENHIFIKTKKLFLPKCIRHMIFVTAKTYPGIMKAYPDYAKINKLAFILYENHQIAIEDDRKRFDKTNLFEVCLPASQTNSGSDEPFLSKKNNNWMQSEVVKNIFWSGKLGGPITIFLKNNEQVLLWPPNGCGTGRIMNLYIGLKKVSQVHSLRINSCSKIYFDTKSNTLQKISKFFEPNMSGILEWCGNESKTISEKGKVLQQFEYDEQNKTLQIIYQDSKKIQICGRENSFL